MSGNNGYQTYIKSATGDDATGITVQITLVPASSGSTGRSTK